MAVNKQRREVRSISTFLWLWHEATGGIAFCFPLDRMLVYCLAHPCPENFIGFPDSSPVLKLYSWVESGSVRVNCGALERKAFTPEEGSNPDLSIQRPMRHALADCVSSPTVYLILTNGDR